METTRGPDVTARRLRRLYGTTPFRVGDALERGFTYEQLRAARASGHLVRPRRGLLRAVATDSRDGSRFDLLAATSRLATDATLSHATAARIHGIWLPGGPDDDVVTVTIPGQPDRRSAGLTVRSSHLEPGDVTVVDGLRVTSVARTAIDVARGTSWDRCLIPLDSATRVLVASATEIDRDDQRSMRPLVGDPERRRAALDVLEKAYRRQYGWPGTRVVRASLPWIDPRSESPFESRSRALILRSPLPAPEIAAVVTGASGARYWADFLWRAQRVIGEADGWAKYGIGPDIRDAIRRERLRQQDLEANGFRVIRWSTDERWPAVLRRLERAILRRLAA